MDRTTSWVSTEQLAWTEHDGPGRPPGGLPPVVHLAIASVLALVFTGLVFADVLCPEHRAWVQVLGSAAIVGCVASTVALVRGWAIAPFLTAATTVAGVAVGVIDAEHDATRGAVVAVAFGLALVGALAIAVHEWRVRARYRRLDLTGRLAPAADVAVPAATGHGGRVPVAGAERAPTA